MSPSPLPDFHPDQDLADQALELLRAAPEGLGEYALIQGLRARHSTHLPRLALSDRLVLFRTHFLLFNALYRLRDRLWHERSGNLVIQPLCIRLLPYAQGHQGLDEADPLRAYYLDTRHLRETTAHDVEALLESFWTRMHGGEERQAALALFELDERDGRIDLPRIRRRYRELVSLHHPDRGGSTSRLQSINRAMEILRRYYR